MKPFLKQLAAQLGREIRQGMDTMMLGMLRGFGFSVGFCLFLSLVEWYAK